MQIEIEVALINAIATIVAALIAVGGVVVIVAHRRLVIQLTEQVESYHELEGRLVERLIELEGREVTDGLIKNRRGLHRDGVGIVDRFMTANEARRIRKRYVG